MKNSRKDITFLYRMVLALVLVYLSIFGYLNLCKYAQHVDSDIAGEALLAREIWIEKTLTPDDWISSTERRVVGMPTLAALFYGLTGSMQLSVGISCVIMGGLFLMVFYGFLRKLFLSPGASLTALLVLCALPMNGLCNDGQIVPFVTLLLFLFAEYYVLHAILVFLVLLFYLHLREQGRLTKRSLAAWIVLFGATALICCGGQRCLQVMILPMTIFEAISLFVESNELRRRLPHGRYLSTAFVGSLLAAYGISTLYGGQRSYDVYLISPTEALQKLLVEVPAAFLENFGLQGEAIVGGFPCFMQMLIWAFLILLGYGLWKIYRKKAEKIERQQISLSVLCVSVLLTAFIIGVTTAEVKHYYFFMAWFAAALVVAILTDRFAAKCHIFADLILIAVCFFAILNLRYTYYEAVLCEDNLVSYEEVADFLVEQQIEYGYAEFWDAERICLITDGKVTMGHCYQMSKLSGYWWLTSTKWYPPSLPTQMCTAYVVRLPEKEAFEGQFTEGEMPTLQYENEQFAVYIGDINFVALY